MAKKAAPKAAESKAALPRRQGGLQARHQDRVLGALADKTGLSKKQVAWSFEALLELLGKELGKKGPGILRSPACSRSRLSQAGHQGSPRLQPRDQAADHDQGQARPQGHQGPAAEGAEGPDLT